MILAEVLQDIQLRTQNYYGVDWQPDWSNINSNNVFSIAAMLTTDEAERNQPCVCLRPETPTEDICKGCLEWWQYVEFECCPGCLNCKKDKLQIIFD